MIVVCTCCGSDEDLLELTWINIQTSEFSLVDHPYFPIGHQNNLVKTICNQCGFENSGAILTMEEFKEFCKFEVEDRGAPIEFWDDREMKEYLPICDMDNNPIKQDRSNYSKALFQCLAVIDEDDEEEECCGGDVVLSGGEGRPFTVRINDKVVKKEIPEDFLLPTCVSCGEYYFNGKDCERLDEILKNEKPI